MQHGVLNKSTLSDLLQNLTLEPLDSLLDPDFAHSKLSHLLIWELHRYMYESFWNILQRKKWADPYAHINVGTIRQPATQICLLPIVFRIMLFIPSSIVISYLMLICYF